MITIASAAAANILNNILRDGPALQLINNLTVTPAPNSVSFSFQTRFASAPVIEIFKYKNSDYTKDMVANNLVTSNESQLAGKARTKKHSYRLPEPPNWVPSSFPGFDDPILAPLEQDSHYWFRITADSADTDITPSVTIGRFWTSKRDVTVTLPELIVYQYGSSDIGNDFDNAVNSVASLFGANPPNLDYHLYLWVGLYDQVNGLVDQAYKGFTSANNNDDLELPFPNVALECPGAHDFLSMFTYGQGNAGAWNIGPFFGVYGLPATSPTEADHGDYSGPWAEALTFTSRLPDTPNEVANPIKLILDSGNFGTDYQLIAWLNVTLTPARHAPIIYATPGPQLIANLKNLEVAKLKSQKMNKLTVYGEKAIASGTPKKLHVFVPGAKHTLWVQTINSADIRRKVSNPFEKIAQGMTAPMAILEDEDGHIDFIARGTNGNAWHAQWNGEVSAASKVKWHDLGQKMNEEIAFLREGKSINIFMLDDNNDVSHCTISGEAKSPKWKSMGGEIVSELQAVKLASGEIFVFGLDKDGTVAYSQPGSNGKTSWESLGSSDNIQLNVLSDGKHVVLFAIDKKRLASKKIWDGKNWSPKSNDWTQLGNLDSLFGPQESN